MSSFTTEAFTLLAIGLVTIGLRTYGRYTSVGLRGLKPDDYIMLLAAVSSPQAPRISTLNSLLNICIRANHLIVQVVYSLETAAAYSVGAIWHGVANNGMTDAERASLDPSNEEYSLRVGGSKTQVAGWSLYTLLLWLLKTAMCIFYIRLTVSLPSHINHGFALIDGSQKDGVDNAIPRIRIGFVLIGTTYIATLLSILLGCTPLHKNWQINPDPGSTFSLPFLSHPRITKLPKIIANLPSLKSTST
jgi:hypothetical protein